MADNQPAIVIGNGSDELKVGFPNNERPHVVFPSAIGRPEVAGSWGGAPRN